MIDYDEPIVPESVWANGNQKTSADQTVTHGKVRIIESTKNILLNGPRNFDIQSDVGTILNVRIAAFISAVWTYIISTRINGIAIQQT